MEERLHIVPVSDSKEHSTTSEYCKCSPVIDRKEKTILVIHNSFDGREFYEP